MKCPKCPHSIEIMHSPAQVENGPTGPCWECACPGEAERIDPTPPTGDGDDSGNPGAI